ncbi:hypothetical protein NUW54_g4952 [Trametes sanguinea]|uniref:Uncharacterized protein n=1 Tax=Trametes sanguinea TaxID=158606 RepID=A0ACC1PY18_9APHY|nr:hypothetical protein NUW54_g4952 [Trametes sanguinea]
MLCTRLGLRQGHATCIATANQSHRFKPLQTFKRYRLWRRKPPKPAVVPPPYRPPSPVRPGILASAMSYRQKKTNGSGKSSVAPDGGDPLPPDWEIRYPRNGGKDAYYFNVKTEESTWVRPRLPPSGKSSPVKDRESTSGQLSPDLEAVWSDRAGRGQGPRTQRRDPTSRVATPPPPADGSLTYQDRHYRPGDVTGAAAKTEIVDRRDERPGTKPTHLSESSHGRTRTPSPQASDRRWRPRSVSPSRQRLPRRDFTPPPRGDMREASRDFDRQADVGWDRPLRQEPVAGIRAAPRSPSGRRVRRKDDIEPPLRRSNDVIEPPRRPDDVDLPIYRRDDVEPRTRRKDDIEARLPRKHDVEPRRNDDIEHPLRPLPRKQPSARHENYEWPASSTLFASSSTSRLQHRRSSRGGGQVFVDCLVKPRGSSNIFPLFTVSPNACRSYDAPARGSLSLPFSLSLPDHHFASLRPQGASHLRLTLHPRISLRLRQVAHESHLVTNDPAPLHVILRVIYRPTSRQTRCRNGGLEMEMTDTTTPRKGA